MKESTKLFLRDTDKQLDEKLKEIKEEKKNKEFLTRFESLFNILIEKSSIKKDEILDSLAKVKIEQPKIEVNVPEVKVPNIIIPEIKVPKIEIPEIKIPKIEVPEVKIPPIKIPEIKMPHIKVPKLEVKIPEIKIPKIEVKMPDKIEVKGKVELDKIDRDNPLPVILTDEDGNFYKAILQAISSGGGKGIGALKTDSEGHLQIDVMADFPKGSGSVGTIALAVVDTWYSVPATAPSKDYTLMVSLENATGTVRFAYVNTGTPSTTNGNQAPNHLAVNLGAGKALYFGSSTAGDDVNFTLIYKE